MDEVFGIFHISTWIMGITDAICLGQNQSWDKTWEAVTPPCAQYVMCLMMQEGPGSWWPLDAEVIMEDGRILATKTRTGHAVLVDCRFEFPAGR